MTVTAINRLSIAMRPGETMMINNEPRLTLLSTDAKGRAAFRDEDTGKVYRWFLRSHIEIADYILTLDRIYTSGKVALVLYVDATQRITREVLT